MDVDALVMTAAARHGIYATGAETFAGPVDGVRVTVVECCTTADAETLANACMSNDIPAKSSGNKTMILH